MKHSKLLLVLSCCALVAGFAQANRLTDKPATIFYPEGHYLEGWPRQVGFDMFGYNYQAHKFQGYFANVYLGGDGFPPYGGDADTYYAALVMYGFFDTAADAEAYLAEEWFWGLRDTHLRMIWNDAWLSNQDRADSSGGGEPDGNLDRHYGFPSYFDSGAVLIQYQVEPMQVERDGMVKTENLYYYSEIVAVKSFLHDPFEDDKPRGRAWGKRIRDAGF